MWTAVLPTDSCAHCRQLFILQALQADGLQSKSSAHHHVAMCQQTGMPAKLLHRVLSISFLSQGAGLASTVIKQHTGVVTEA